MAEKTVLLSAFLVVHNEEAQLAEAIAQLAFADEVVVVLDRCSDRSKEIALSKGARIVEGAWPIEGQRRHVGQEACSGTWIFEIDADERVSPELAKEIKETITASEAKSKGDQPDWWSIPFDNYIGDRLIRYGWGAQFGVGARITLYRKGSKYWGNQRVHPKVKMSGKNGGMFAQRMIHYVDINVSDMIQRLDRYTSLRALDIIDEGMNETYRKNALRILGRFYKCFIRRKGYKEGALGLQIALFAGLYPFLSYLKAVELTKRTD